MGIDLGMTNPRSGKRELKALLNSSAHVSGSVCSRMPVVKKLAWSITSNNSAVLMTGAWARHARYNVHTICNRQSTN